MTGYLLTVRVTPRSARDEVRGFADGVLHVRLRSAPVDGRANEALVRLLAGRLGLPRSAIAIVSGTTARLKRVQVSGLDAGAVQERLGS
jgi:hypothetical protein